MSERADVVVIGAGVAGLTIASELRRLRRGIEKVVVLEARERVGGRVLSVKEKGAMLYESGAWRVASSHKRVLAMFERERVTLRPLRTDGEDAMPEAGVRGLSIWGSNALRSGDPSAADRADLATGYADETMAAAGTAPYLTDAKHFYCADAGFSTVMERLAAKCEDVRKGRTVTDLEKLEKQDSAQGAKPNYRVSYTEREESTNRKTRPICERSIICSAVFICVPPRCCKLWQAMRDHAMPLLCAVRSESLCHIYIDSASGKENHSPSWARRPFHEKGNPQSLLGQTLTDQYGNRFLQASYSSGRLARFWNNLRLSWPGSYIDYINSELWRTLGLVLPSLRFESVKHHFWQEAFHMWVPASHFDLEKNVKNAITPNSVKLPQVFYCGEAFSSLQAWMEGALQTTELALAAYINAQTPPTRSKGENEMNMDGRLLDVSLWKKVHPGSEAAIQNHMHDQDAYSVFKHINHSEFAYATIYNLQVGWHKI